MFCVFKVHAFSSIELTALYSCGILEALAVLDGLEDEAGQLLLLVNFFFVDLLSGIIEEGEVVQIYVRLFVEKQR